MCRLVPPFVAALVLIAIFAPAPSLAGGALETLDITGRKPGGIPGFVIAQVVPQRWDRRCIPVPFQINETLDPIPNPLGADFLTLEDAATAVGEAMETWNSIPTSFLDMRLTGTTSNPGPQSFDTRHEITFRTGPGFDPRLIASSVLHSLMEDSELAPGTDLDGDGDSDVAAGIEVCADADGDGDIELPAGFYRAGTIIDSDIQFNTDLVNGFRFTVSENAADTERKSVDLPAVALHELGHSHGLAHTLSNQNDDRDGTGATMFPFIDTTDPADELSWRSLEVEDLATSSFFYPEGSAAQGPAALGVGDLPFTEVFGVLEGEAFHGRRALPLAGGSVFAVDVATNTTLGSAITGSVQVLFRLSTGTWIPSTRDPGFNLRDGRFALALPFGAYRLGIEAVDGAPVDDDVVNITTDLADRLRLADFPEELYNGALEAAVEVTPGLSVPVVVNRERLSRVELVTNRVARLGGDKLPNASREAIPGKRFAVRFPVEDLALATGGRDFALVAALFHTQVFDNSTVPVFSRAVLTTGTLAGDGTAILDLSSPLAEVRRLFAQDNDEAPWFFHGPVGLGRKLRQQLDRGELDDLFLVIEGPADPLPGVSQRWPFLGARYPSQAGGSFVSTEGGPFVRDTEVDLLFALLISEPLPPVHPEGEEGE